MILRSIAVFYFACLLLGMVPAFASDQPRTLKVASDIWKPFFDYEAQTPSGLSYELVKETLKRAGHSLEITYYPNRRLRMLFQKGQVDMLLLDSPKWLETAERDISLFTDPLMSIHEYAYVRDDNPKVFNAPYDFKGMTLAINAGYHYALFEPQSIRGEITLHEVESAESLPTMVLANRVDGFFMDEFLFAQLVREDVIDPDMFRKAFLVTGTELAFRLHVKNQKLLPGINRALQSMKKDGFITARLKAYRTEN